jgi:hypothetical protein
MIPTGIQSEDHMGRRITTVHAAEMLCPPQAALVAIWEIKNIERTEVKADAVDVNPDDPRHGTYDVRGHFAGLPWRGQFAYELNEGGFHSRNAGVPPSEATIEGGFVVTPNADGCTVIHYEQYVIPTWLAPAKPAIRVYLRWSMRRELRDLERLLSGRLQPRSRTATVTAG